MSNEGSSTTPFEAAHWDLNPGRTVLVIIDPQNDFLHEDGWYAQQGIDIAHMQRTIEPTQQLLADVRAKNIPVIWTRHGSRGVEDGGPFMRLRPFLQDGGLRQDTWGYEILEDLAPREADWFVEKTRLSAFYNTNLEGILRALNADTVLFAGVLTNQCVAATSKDANFRDFKPIVIEDCTGTTMPHLHDPAIEMMRVGWCEVRDLESTLGEIRQIAANT
ncbi:MAG: cysteine hydrolase [Rhodospirillaceae bacterium]|nr:cysteine hydrolase [Rhodospirillaceae bacterium]